MSIDRYFDVGLLRRFGRRLRALSATEWELLVARVEPFRGDDIRRVWHRSEHWARALPTVGRRARGVFQLVATVDELANEFWPRADSSARLARSRGFIAARSPGLVRDFLDALIEVREAVASRAPGDRVLEEVVASAANAAARRLSVAPEDLRRVWEPLEPVIPLAELIAES